MTNEQAAAMGTFLLEAAEREFKTTKKVLAAVPDAQLGFTLGEKGRPVRDLMWHIATVDVWFLNSVADGAFPEGKFGSAPGSTKEIVDTYERQFTPAAARVRALSPEQMAKPVTFYNMTLPACLYLQFLANHMIHHRGQLSMCLRAMNAKVPSIYGPSADDSGGM